MPGHFRVFARRRGAERHTAAPISTVAIGFAFLVLLLSGCQSHHASAQSTPPALPTPISHPPFDADRAFGFLTEQCKFGPRVPNTDPHEACKDYIVKELTPYVDRVEAQPFVYRDTSRKKTLRLTNILGVINPRATRKIMLFTHWDTRPTADEELDADKRLLPIPGADDGASGTAILLELARVFHEKRPDVCVELLFVDGEDWGPDDAHMYLGARHFAAKPVQYKPEYAILLDMVGDKILEIHREQGSEMLESEIDDKVWNAAKIVGHQAEFPSDAKYRIYDDHDSFNSANIPAIDLIDFDYAYWHTLEDTPDKCSARSLGIVGDVMAQVIYSER